MKMFTSHIHHHLHLYLLLLLSISPFRTPQIFPLSSVAGSGLMAMSAWTLFWWCIQFLASSSYLWLLIPILTASFQLCQHKHLCSCAGNQIGELIQLKITSPPPSQFSGRAVVDVAGWWKAGGQQYQEVGLGEQDPFLAPQHLVMLA